jgi:hypothetical protein
MASTTLAAVAPVFVSPRWVGIDEIEAAIAADELLPLVYEELRRLAARKMAQVDPGQTLQPTALVHEAWLKLAGSPLPLR